MPSQLQPLYELQRFDDSIVGTRLHHNIAKGSRRFEALADAESIMLLQLGVELGLFPVDAAENLLKKHQKRFLTSLNYVETRGLSPLFGGELRLLVSGMGVQGLKYVPHPNKLSPQLFDGFIIEVLIHELGRNFRKGAFTISILFDSSDVWNRRLKGTLQPEAILRGKLSRGISLLTEQYLTFLEHAGSLTSIWNCLAESTTPYALDQLQKRIRAMHNWRVYLENTDVRRRIESVTAVFVRALMSDGALTEIGFEVTEAVARIEGICRDWTGDEGLTLNLPSDCPRLVRERAA